MKKLRISLNILFAVCILSPFISFADDSECVLLLYHRFSDEEHKSTSTSPKVFKGHLEYLIANEYKVLPLSDVVQKLKAQEKLPKKCVSLTADDGFLSFYTEAYPLLVKYQLPMSVFVSTESIDKGYELMMSWQQLREMSGLVDVYNHSIKHLHLVDQDALTLQNEITLAQERITKELGIEDKFFAYPYGEFDDNTYSLLSSLGYIGFGQQSGVVSNESDFLNLPRFSMSGPYAAMDSFTLKINTLHMPVDSEDPMSMVISGDFMPLLTLSFSRSLTTYEKANFSCYVSGQDKPELKWLSPQMLTVKPKKPLKIGRSRYNCTMPSEERGRYYWYSKLWLKL